MKWFQLSRLHAKEGKQTWAVEGDALPPPDPGAFCWPTPAAAHHYYAKARGFESYADYISIEFYLENQGAKYAAPLDPTLR